MRWWSEDRYGRFELGASIFIRKFTYVRTYIATCCTYAGGARLSLTAAIRISLSLCPSPYTYVMQTHAPLNEIRYAHLSPVPRPPTCTHMCILCIYLLFIYSIYICTCLCMYGGSSHKCAHDHKRRCTGLVQGHPGRVWQDTLAMPFC